MQTSSKNKEIEIIISQKDGAKFLTKIPPENFGGHPHHLLPNVTIYENICTNKFIMTGDVGINKELIDNDYPLFYIHKDNWRQMINARTTGNEELLSRLIGEKWGIKETKEIMNLPPIHTQYERDVPGLMKLRNEETLDYYNSENKKGDSGVTNTIMYQQDKLDYGDSISGLMVERAMENVGANEAKHKSNTQATKEGKDSLVITSVANIKTKMGHFLSKAFSWGQN